MVTDFSKQIELINVWDIKTKINIIGCGALGSWIALLLFKMGFDNIDIYDFDDVEEHNLPNQCFGEKHIKKFKTEAIADVFNFFSSKDDTRNINVFDKKVTVKDALEMEGILISAVDSMRVRELLFTAFKKNKKLELFLEGRLSIYGAYVYAIDKDTDFEKYEATLYDDTEAEVSACGVSQTALPSAVNASSIIVMQMIQHLNGQELTNKIEYSIPWLDKMEGKWKKEQ